MILEVLKFPDPRLREKSLPVTEFDSHLKKLADDLLETMYSARGIGLAAAQVGELKQMLVIDCRPKPDTGKRRQKNDEDSGEDGDEEVSELEAAIHQPLIIINPKIVKKVGKTTFDEGCLSVPTFFETVERAELITLEYQNVKGEKLSLKTDGLLAIVIQHEMDHLDGTLFIDRISFLKSNKIKSQIKKHGYPERNRKSDEDSNSDSEGL